jgi:hypothetical protein
MRSLRLGAAALVVSCLMAGCEGGGSGESTATPENPQAGLDAIKKLQSGPQPTAKGLMPVAPQGKTETPPK